MYRIRLSLVFAIVIFASVLHHALTIFTQVPSPAYKNGRYNFICEYEIEKGNSYEARWFKDATEDLLKCHSSGRVQLFENAFNKIWAYNTQNGTCNFIMSDIDKDNEGNYTCQVNVQGPKPAVLNSTRYIKVEEMPKDDGPAVTISKYIILLPFLACLWPNLFI